MLSVLVNNMSGRCRYTSVVYTQKRSASPALKIGRKLRRSPNIQPTSCKHLLHTYNFVLRITSRTRSDKNSIAIDIRRRHKTTITKI